MTAVSLEKNEAKNQLEIIESRYKKVSTIFCSQFKVAGWYHKIGELTLADAICDRIVHESYIIVICGKDFMCEKKGIENNVLIPFSTKAVFQINVLQKNYATSGAAKEATKRLLIRQTESVQ